MGCEWSDVLFHHLRGLHFGCNRCSSTEINVIRKVFVRFAAISIIQRSFSKDTCNNAAPWTKEEKNPHSRNRCRYGCCPMPEVLCCQARESRGERFSISSGYAICDATLHSNKTQGEEACCCKGLRCCCWPLWCYPPTTLYTKGAYFSSVFCPNIKPNSSLPL